jgi:hypothetical protein
MKKVCCTMDLLREGKITTGKSLFLMTLVLALSASPAFALTVPSGTGIGMAIYTLINGIYTTGLGYVIAGCMFLWGCIHLPKDWKDSLLWMAGGMGAGSLVTLIGATGLVL